MPDPIVIEIVLVMVVPVIAAVGVLRWARTAPAIGLYPVRTTLVLFVLLLVAVSLLSPGGDLTTPTIGGIVAAVACAAVFVELRRRARVRSL